VLGGDSRRAAVLPHCREGKIPLLGEPMFEPGRHRPPQASDATARALVLEFGVDSPDVLKRMGVTEYPPPADLNADLEAATLAELGFGGRAGYG